MDERVKQRTEMVQKMLSGGIADIDDFLGEDSDENLDSSGGSVVEGNAEAVPEEKAASVRTSVRKAGRKQRKEVVDADVCSLHLRLPAELKVELQISAIRAHKSMNDYVISLVRKNIATNGNKKN